jgi:hypothetical protein
MRSGFDQSCLCELLSFVTLRPGSESKRADPLESYQNENTQRLALIPTLFPEGEGLKTPLPAGEG